MSACDHWAGAEFCGADEARLYLPGMRCPTHTPAAMAGHPEPGRTATNLPKMAPLPQSASRVNDDRAVASGKRRSTPEQYREAQTRTAKERKL